MNESQTSFVVQVPHTNWNGAGADMRSRLQTWRWHWPLAKKFHSLVLDFSQVQFIEPWALALFTSYALGLRAQQQVSVDVKLDPENPCNQYIEQMGLRACLRGESTSDDWDSSAQNTGLHIIRTNADVTKFYRSTSRLGGEIGRQTLDALGYAMAELARNVVQHSGSLGGGVAIAQRFPDRKAIQIAIADTGRGILGALNKNYPELRTDLEALKLALLPHVSGAASAGGDNVSVDNAGLGLFFSKEIAWRSNGSFWVASKSALLGIQDEDIDARNRVYRHIESWPGTLVTIDIPEDGVKDFSEFLRICRELAERARQLSGPAGLDFLQKIPELDEVEVIRVAEFLEDVDAAARIRDGKIIPTVRRGGKLAIDFSDVRFVTQSFIHAMLHEALREPGALVRISLVNCSRSTREAIQAVAAYSASYRQIQF